MKPLEKIIWQSDGMIAAHIFEGPVLSPDGSKLYFSDVRDERIYEINTSILKNIPSGFQPKCILQDEGQINGLVFNGDCLLYTSPSPRDQRGSRMPSSA